MKWWLSSPQSKQLRNTRLKENVFTKCVFVVNVTDQTHQTSEIISKHSSFAYFPKIEFSIGSFSKIVW